MARLNDKIENVLNETRILVLGIQILIGFGFRGFFEPRFEQMPGYARELQLGALALMLAGLGVLMVPAAYHRIVLHGRNTAEFHRLATATVSAGLLPFAIAMAGSLYLGARFVVGDGEAALFAGALLLLTLLAWYGLELWGRSRRRGGLQLAALLDPLREVDMSEEERTDLGTRVKEVLVECRVVLPGAQALLGFQLIIIWMTAFEHIPQAWKLLHLASLTAIAVCTILLILPAAYHRIVEQGENSEMLHHITAVALLWAMGFLALGVCGDFYVVARMTGLDATMSLWSSLALLAFFLGAWFGYALWKRQKVHDLAITRSHLAGHPAAKRG